jgi:hypothetical protein
VAETPIRGRWTATHWLCPECNAFDGPIRRAGALAVRRAALDPDAQPETPEERHHRELHDGTLNEMPPEERHARAGS